MINVGDGQTEESAVKEDSLPSFSFTSPQGVCKFSVVVTVYNFSSAACKEAASLSALTAPFFKLSQGGFLGFAYQFLFY